ncbi:MAG: hypothetical protein GVY12_10545 [Bacteroidetes bacterium]|jgi:proteic killer suppression protein|nr:hypothetical protein [Bacteroidota bacterium]
MIKSFADSETKKVFERTYSKKLPEDIQLRARRKLVMVDAARKIQDLRLPPGNKLEKLRGDREGQYSIRINKQWRICFRWHDGDAYDHDGDAYEVEIDDYH